MPRKSKVIFECGMHSKITNVEETEVRDLLAIVYVLLCSEVNKIFVLYIPKFLSSIAILNFLCGICVYVLGV